MDDDIDQRNLKIKDIISSNIDIDHITIKFNHEINLTQVLLQYNLPSHKKVKKSINLSTIDKILELIRFDLIFIDEKLFLYFKEKINTFSFQIIIDYTEENSITISINPECEAKVSDFDSMLSKKFDKVETNDYHRKCSKDDFQKIISYFIDPNNRDIHIQWTSCDNLLEYPGLIAVHFDWIYPELEQIKKTYPYIRIAIIKLDPIPSLDIIAAFRQFSLML